MPSLNIIIFPSKLHIFGREKNNLLVHENENKKNLFYILHSCFQNKIFTMCHLVFSINRINKNAFDIFGCLPKGIKYVFVCTINGKHSEYIC